MYSNFAYDGRDLAHPELGEPIRIWDFHNSSYYENRWLVEYPNKRYALYFHTKLAYTISDKYFLIVSEDLIHSADWQGYINSSSPPIELIQKSYSSKEFHRFCRFEQILEEGD